MKKVLIPLLAFAAILMAACGTPGLASSTDSNQVDYWCPAGGVKIDPASTPFVVPAPPEGTVWTLLVLKAGSEQSADPENEQFPNPVVGQAYSRTDGKSISHVILCHDPTATTTSTTTTTTTSTTLPPPPPPPPPPTTVPGETTTTTSVATGTPPVPTTTPTTSVAPAVRVTTTTPALPETE
jgi:hypothetical protein